MATFGSLSLLIALALAAYNLFAGIVALRLLATGQPAPIAPERLADTARRAGIAAFFAVTAAAFEHDATRDLAPAGFSVFGVFEAIHDLQNAGSLFYRVVELEL